MGSQAGQLSLTASLWQGFGDASAFVRTPATSLGLTDSLDKYWAAESRTKLPLNGIRVPVEGDTIGEAKRALAADLAAQLRLLLLLNASHKGLAPQLQENLAFLNSIMNPAPGSGT